MPVSFTSSEVSSAKELIIQSTSILKRSLIKIINSKGPRIDPCGTPDLILRRFEFEFLEKINCCLFSR